VAFGQSAETHAVEDARVTEASCTVTDRRNRCAPPMEAIASLRCRVGPVRAAVFAILPPRRAVIFAYVGGWLFLPMLRIKFPGVPDLDIDHRLVVLASCSGVDGSTAAP
jgi:hypothetical protein